MSEVVAIRVALVSTSRTVTVAPGTPAPLESVTVPAIDPVMPCPNELGSSHRTRASSRAAKRAEHQIDLFAGGIPVFLVCCGISNEVFITSPFLTLPRTSTRCISRLTVQTVGAAQFPESLLGARSDSDLRPGAPTGTLFFGSKHGARRT